MPHVFESIYDPEAVEPEGFVVEPGRPVSMCLSLVLQEVVQKAIMAAQSGDITRLSGTES